jgi:PAS domain S-box-containing protein
MVVDEHSQVESQSRKRSNRSLSGILQASNDWTWSQGRFSPGRILAITIGAIALAEVIAMIVVYYVRDWSYGQQVLLDASVLTAIIFPLLYFLSFKPLLLQIQQRRQSESIIQSRLRLMQFANTHTLDELLHFALDEIQTLTDSTLGCFHCLEADQKTVWLQAWSTNTLPTMCRVEGQDSQYHIDQTGVWADAIRHRQPIVRNNFPGLPHRHGMPAGHATVVREMAIPILRDKKVMAILGLGNKPRDFTEKDVAVVSTFADFAWDIAEHKQAENAIRASEEKFRTLVDWTYDWEMWLDPRGYIVYTSPSCERITGYSPEEFIADPDLLIRIVHPDDWRSFEEHHRLIHDASAGPIRIEYRSISRDGSEHWIEHVCRPLFGPDSRYLGRRVSNRDITERKLTEKKIIEQNRKELVLTQTIQTIQTEIARDLHDTLGQNISFLRMNLEHLSEAQWSDPADVKIKIHSMTKAANESYELIRAMLGILQSGNSADPLSLFTRHAEQVAKRSSAQIDVTSLGHPQQLSPPQIRQLFYIFREALSNIEKYANAGRVSGEFIWEEHALTFGISDNGSGFDPDAIQTRDHYGLRFMRERAELLQGSFSIQSAPRQGTKITVIVPYENELSTQSQ